MAADLLLYLLFVLLLVIPVIVFTTRRSRRVVVPPSRRRRAASTRAVGELMTLRFGELRAVVASCPDAAREIMKTHDAAFASRPLSPMMELGYQSADSIIFAPYGDGWRQLRKI